MALCKIVTYIIWLSRTEHGIVYNSDLHYLGILDKADQTFP